MPLRQRGGNEKAFGRTVFAVGPGQAVEGHGESSDEVFALLIGQLDREDQPQRRDHLRGRVHSTDSPAEKMDVVASLALFGSEAAVEEFARGLIPGCDVW